MKEREIKFTLQVFANPDEMHHADAKLLQEAKDALSNAYAPYSNFKVGAAILLDNGKTVTGSNQENAAFPAGLCAEATALSAASSLYPEVAVKKIAITVKSGSHIITHPVAPCGVCRQRLQEYETRSGTDIEVILMGERGEVYSIQSVKDLLPLQFTKLEL